MVNPLETFFTNTDRAVFGLQNLPEAVKGAMFARYSRSEAGLREIILEFINKDAAASSGEALLESNAQKAEAFYDRVLIGYGDDSVAELGGAHIACEQVSNIAAKLLEDNRIGLSPLEKSSRYVRFDRQVNGEYPYYTDPEIANSNFKDLYKSTLDQLFETYSSLIEPVDNWLKSLTPKAETVSERAYNSSIRAQTLDLLRGLLPMATLTNVGLYGNGRAFEHLLVKLTASPYSEAVELSQAMYRELSCLIPSFVKRFSTDRGMIARDYLKEVAANVVKTKTTLPPFPAAAPSTTSSVKLIEWDDDADVRVAEAILYSLVNSSSEEINQYTAGLNSNELNQLINAYVGPRQSRFQKPGRAFEHTNYTFEVIADLGAWRDLQRHRICIQQAQPYTTDLGYFIPPELIAAGYAQPYTQALETTRQTYQTLCTELSPHQASYCIPMAFNTRWLIKLNLREAYHFIELRSARQGHSSYRQVAIQMYELIAATHPNLAAGMKFVDLNSYDLARLAAEERLDQKLKQKLNQLD